MVARVIPVVALEQRAADCSSTISFPHRLRLEEAPERLARVGDAAEQVSVHHWTLAQAWLLPRVAAAGQPRELSFRASPAQKLDYRAADLPVRSLCLLQAATSPDWAELEVALALVMAMVPAVA